MTRHDLQRRVFPDSRAERRASSRANRRFRYLLPKANGTASVSKFISVSGGRIDCIGAMPVEQAFDVQHEENHVGERVGDAPGQ